MYESIYQRPILNLYGKSHSMKVLFSYSTYHFNSHNYSSHSNYQESNVIANIFDKLGYQVDIINNDREYRGSFSEYDLVFGEGIPMFQVIEKEVKAKIIYYGSGSHPWQCANASLTRLVDFYKLHKVTALASARINDYRWGLAASMANYVICIGNETTKQTFIDNGSSAVFPLDPTFIERNDSESILNKKNFAVARKHALWFGSYGLLHKGLDITIEAFRSKPDWTLHICGYTEAEKKLLQVINPPSNVVIHGFVNVLSDSFKNIALQCGFVILPSCSEGTATAIITAVGNGAMIPIVTNACGFDIDDFGFNIELSEKSLITVLEKTEEFPETVLKQMAISANNVVRKRYTLNNFEVNIESYINKILSEINNVRK
jgi:hypothetical protein